MGNPGGLAWLEQIAKHRPQGFNLNPSWLCYQGIGDKVISGLPLIEPGRALGVILRRL
jgi:hypothetical protein